MDKCDCLTMSFKAKCLLACVADGSDNNSFPYEASAGIITHYSLHERREVFYIMHHSNRIAKPTSKALLQ